MGEIGKVIETVEDMAVISLIRNEACAKCRACIAGTKQEEMIIRAKNICGASVGDNVELELRDGVFLKASLIVFFLPLVMFLIGIAVGYGFCSLFDWNQFSEIIAFLVGLVFAAAQFFIIKINEKRFRKDEYKPSAIKIVLTVLDEEQ